MARAVIRAAAVLLLLAAANAQVGQTIKGYKFEINQYSYFEVSNMIQKVVDAVKAGDTARAKRLYSVDAIGGTKSNWTPKRTLKIFATGDQVSRYGSRIKNKEPWHMKYAAYYGSQCCFIDQFLGDFKDPVRVEVGLLWDALALCANQMDRVTNWLRAGYPAQNVAVAEVDDTMGTYIGYDGKPSLWKLHADTKAKCGNGNDINTQVAPILTEMRKAARVKNYGAISKQYAAFFKVQITGLLRAVVYQASVGTRDAQKRAAFYLRMIQPLLNGQADAKALQAALSSATLADPAQVTALAKKLAGAQGITQAHVVCN